MGNAEYMGSRNESVPVVTLSSKKLYPYL